MASAQSGSELTRQGSLAKMDFSKLSLTQAKRLEMESQVKALELEKELEMERKRLAELRKIHYHLAGASEGWEVCICMCRASEGGGRYVYACVEPVRGGRYVYACVEPVRGWGGGMYMHV